MLLAWNLYLALQNKTTIEFHEGVTAKIKVYSQEIPTGMPFNSLLDSCLTLFVPLTIDRNARSLLAIG